MSELYNRLPTDNDIKNNCCNHNCSCCGNCCTEFIPLTKKEYETIKKRVVEKKLKGHYLVKDKSTFDGNVRAFCPFLNPDTKKCEIYDIRPYPCRKFKCDQSMPVISKNRDDFAKRAIYNGCDKSPNDKGQISWHALFFDDIEFDLMYRHLVIKSFGYNLTYEQEKAIMPMLVDS